MLTGSGVWNPNFVQRPGQNYRLWLSGASRPVISGIIWRAETTGEVRYEVRVSEAFAMSRPDYFRVTDLDTGQDVPCNLVQVGANSPGVGITCSADVRRTRLELRGWTSLSGLPVSRPNGSDPVFEVDWKDSQSVDRLGGLAIWHESQTPPFP